MERDEYGEVINGDRTYSEIAHAIIERHETVLIGWNDKQYTHYDIIFGATPKRVGVVQGGRAHCDIFVAIYGVGCAGFRADTESSVDYVAEKLFNTRRELERRETEDIVAITELINGVKRAYYSLKYKTPEHAKI